MNVAVPAGNLEQHAQLIESLMQQRVCSRRKVDYKTWSEQHDQSAFHWDVVDIESEEVRLAGWSYAKYDADGKLLVEGGLMAAHEAHGFVHCANLSIQPSCRRLHL